jgi:hypothetical protein
MNRLLSIFIGLALVGPTLARAQERPMKAVTGEGYEKQLLLESGFGKDFDLARHADGNLLEALAYRQPSSFSFSTRVTFFWSRHWGAYANMQFFSTGKEGVHGKAYGQRLDALRHDFYVDPPETWGDGELGYSMDIGVAYRIALGRWLIYPRLGFGVTNAECEIPTGGIDLKEKGGQGMYNVSYQGKGNWRGTIDLPMLSGGISVSYRLLRWLRLTLNGTYVQPLRRLTLTETTTDLYTDQVVDTRTYHSSTLGRHLYADIGLTIPIYLGRRRTASSTRQRSHRKRANELMQHGNRTKIHPLHSMLHL